LRCCKHQRMLLPCREISPWQTEGHSLLLHSCHSRSDLGGSIGQACRDRHPPDRSSWRPHLPFPRTPDLARAPRACLPCPTSAQPQMWALHNLSDVPLLQSSPSPGASTPHGNTLSDGISDRLRSAQQPNWNLARDIHLSPCPFSLSTAWLPSLSSASGNERRDDRTFA